ncbi:MAG: protein translocase subunit SecD [Xanthomonadaceae bacterium]|nr:protein translocase subunit SecD [Xanthomonadaceae bacterium]
MNKSWWTKLVLLIVFIATSAVYSVPTLFNLDLEKTKWPFKQKINLGLDLQGGLYMVLGVDFDKVFKEVIERQSSTLAQNLKEKSIIVSGVKVLREGFPGDDSRIVISLGAGAAQAVKDYIKKEYTILRFTGEKPGELEFGLDREYKNDVREKTINQSIEVIRNRVDEFGVAEPQISSQGNDRVVVELPGIKEIQRAKDLIGRTAKLEFKIADDKNMDANFAKTIDELEKKVGFDPKQGAKFSEFVAEMNKQAKGKIPEGTEIAYERVKSLTVKDDYTQRIPYLLFTRADVTGDDLQDASVGFEQESRRPNVDFSLNPRGAEKFGKLTSENVGKRLAIVLDGIVHSAPVINSKITERGQITLGRDNTEDIMKEAKDLAIVLRAGALPAQLDFLEQRIVGPSLGADSIQKGAMAGVIGCILVFIFMSLYYRMSGVVASISLMLNALFLISLLIMMEATLTLPGMAGIALTIGMAVDSNVIIFERIRDELQEGKSVGAAVSAGFQKAFTAIFDANITHGIIAVVLMSYGTGAIRGFAVTLLVGIFTTLFCAVTVCKLFFDGYLANRRAEITTLSI